MVFEYLFVTYFLDTCKYFYFEYLNFLEINYVPITNCCSEQDFKRYPWCTTRKGFFVHKLLETNVLSAFL